MNKIRYLDRTLVSSPYRLGLCVTEKAFHAEMRRLRVPREWPEWVVGERAGATAHFFENDELGLIAIVCIRPDKHRSREEIHALLAHEAVHIWQEVKREIREKAPSDEFEAWSIQAICLRLFDAYRDMTKRGKAS